MTETMFIVLVILVCTKQADRWKALGGIIIGVAIWKYVLPLVWSGAGYFVSGKVDWTPWIAIGACAGLVIIANSKFFKKLMGHHDSKPTS